MKLLLMLEDLPDPKDGFKIAMTPSIEEIRKDPELLKEAEVSGALKAILRSMEIMHREVVEINEEAKKDES